MKTVVLILLVLSTLGCSVMQYEPKFSLGMTEQEFKKANKDAIQAYGDDKGMVIYRTFNSLTQSFKFFRFSKEKLVQFGEGIYPDDYKLLPL
ncbi:hypothetical protein [Pedobacter sp. ASV28]|uniref:hypothetical protein n=1 Tax=Pedobacter sp. ASV28 TaxID=2795123 RepID=UPI0018ED55D3|nr:hypothetical protein [Pedobacter sp. ASV28]